MIPRSPFQSRALASWFPAKLVPGAFQQTASKVYFNANWILRVNCAPRIWPNWPLLIGENVGPVVELR
jgi:hypothetical protein